MIDEGQLNRKVKIEKKTGGKDPAGQPRNIWSLHKEKWADIRTPSGLSTITEHAGDGLTQAITGYSIRVRYDRSITVGMRVNYKDQDYYDIKGVKHDMKDREYSDLICALGGRDA